MNHEDSLPGISGGNMTVVAPHKPWKLIAPGRLTLGDRSVVRRVVPTQSRTRYRAWSQPRSTPPKQSPPICTTKPASTTISHHHNSQPRSTPSKESPPIHTTKPESPPDPHQQNSRPRFTPPSQSQPRFFHHQNSHPRFTTPKSPPMQTTKQVGDGVPGGYEHEHMVIPTLSYLISSRL